MDPITLAIIAAALLGTGGYVWYKRRSAQASASARSIVLDAGLPDGDKQTVIAAIMTETDPAKLDALNALYIGYPWTAYELSYRAWELRGSQGTAPTAPTVPGQATPLAAPPTVSTPSGQDVPPGPVVAPPGTAQTGPASIPDLTAQAAALAEQALAAALGATTPVAPGAPAAPPATPPAAPAPTPPVALGPPFDLGAAGVPGAWQSNPKFIAAYQSALKYLSTVANQPSWDPGTINGIWFTPTNSAVEAFQAANNLPVTGEVDAATANAMQAIVSSSLSGNLPAVPTGVMGGAGEQVGSSADRDGAAEGVMGVGAPAGLAAAAAQAAIPRPPGPHLVVRPTDKVWPRTIASIGTGVPRGAQGSLPHLADINPHLAASGTLRALVPGDEVNVPASWVEPLRKKGFEVRTA